MPLEIAKYFASLGIRVSKQDQKKVDTFLGNLEKGLKGNVKGTNDLEKAVKKETKTAVDGAKQKVAAQKLVNKETLATAAVTNKLTQAVSKQQQVHKRNVESINKLFPAMGSKPLPARSRERMDANSIYKDMFKAADTRIKDLNRLSNKVREEGQLLSKIGRNSPHFANLPNMGKMREISALGRIGKNAQAFSAVGRVQAYKDTKTQGLSREVSALGRIGRNAPTYGAVQRGSLQERLAAYRSINTGRMETQNKIEASERRILDAKRREDSRRLSHQQRMERDNALHQQRMQLQSLKNANAIARQQRLGAIQGGGRSSASYGRANYLHAGGATGAFMRYGAESLPLIGGVYGLGMLNRANQEAISARLTTQAVVEAQGLVGQGDGAFDWLRNQANRIGFSYMEQAQDYNNFLSNSLGAGLGLGESQDIYLGFAEYSKAMGITPARQKLVMNALSQMQGKGVVSMEELRRQMAESMPGTMSVFAEAYQTMTGGGLQGQEALAALMEAVPTGTVKSAKLLPIVAELMRKRAAPKLDIAMRTSAAEQERFKNARADATILASASGVESAFLKIFRAFRIGLEESNGLVRSLASTLDMAATGFEKLVLFPQSFARALDGRDSLVAEWLGVGATEDLREDWATIKALIDSIFSMEVPSWMVTFESTAKEIAMLLGALAKFQQFKERSVAAAEQIYFDEYYSNDLSTPSKRTWANLKGYAKANLHTFKNVITGSSDDSAHYLAQREAYNGTDISPYMDDRGFNPMSYWKGQEQRSRDYAMEAFGEGGLSISRKTAGTYIAESRNENKIDVKIILQGGDTEENRSYFRNDFRTELDIALLNLGQETE